MRKFLKILFVASATILLAGYLIPERKAMPHQLLPLVLSILAGFCFPASFLINCSSIAAVLKKYRKSEEINLHL